MLTMFIEEKNVRASLYEKSSFGIFPSFLKKTFATNKLNTNRNIYQINTSKTTSPQTTEPQYVSRLNY